MKAQTAAARGWKFVCHCERCVAEARAFLGGSGAFLVLERRRRGARCCCGGRLLMTPTDVRVRRPFFVLSRSCVCVSVGMWASVLFYPTSTPSPRRARGVCNSVCFRRSAPRVTGAEAVCRRSLSSAAAARAAARRRRIGRRREVAGEEPEVRRPVPRNSKMLPEPRVADHRRLFPQTSMGLPVSKRWWSSS